MKKYTATCPVCGKEYQVKRPHRPSKTCSRACGRFVIRQRARPATHQPETNTYLIPLTRGYFVTVDAADSDLAAFKWYAFLNRHGNIYACRKVRQGGTTRMVYMHRVILERMLWRDLWSTEEVDHVRGGGLINTRGNLRLATPKQNQANREIAKNNTSGYKGVYWNRGTKKWCAQITKGGRVTYLGSRDTAEAAHALYCEAAKEEFGEFFNPGNRIG